VSFPLDLSVNLLSTWMLSNCLTVFWSTLNGSYRFCSYTHVGRHLRRLQTTVKLK
jgi:hypothetical protein